MSSQKKIINLVKICAFLVFIGRAYQYLFFDAPFRSILWDQALMEPIVEGMFNTPWEEYASNLRVDYWIQKAIRFNGWIFVLAAISSLLLSKKNIKWTRWPIFIGGGLLVLLSALSMKEKFFHYGQFFEHAIQFGVPFVAVAMVAGRWTMAQSLNILKVLIGVTFTSHGLYALGYYPVPGHFIDMTINSLGITEDQSRIFLYIAGILDLVLSVLIFIPKTQKPALWYAAFWGLATASARLVGQFYPDFLGLTFHQGTYQVVYRLAHGLIPLAAIWMVQSLASKKKQTNAINLKFLTA